MAVGLYTKLGSRLGSRLGSKLGGGWSTRLPVLPVRLQQEISPNIGELFTGRLTSLLKPILLKKQPVPAEEPVSTIDIISGITSGISALGTAAGSIMTGLAAMTASEKMEPTSVGSPILSSFAGGGAGAPAPVRGGAEALAPMIITTPAEAKGLSTEMKWTIGIGAGVLGLLGIYMFARNRK